MQLRFGVFVKVFNDDPTDLGLNSTRTRRIENYRIHVRMERIDLLILFNLFGVPTKFDYIPIVILTKKTRVDPGFSYL